MRAVIFDLDGTLIDSAPDIHAAANSVLVEAGFQPLDFATIRGFIGRGVAHLLASALQHLGHSPDHPAKPAMIARFEHHYETAHGLTRLYPNVPASLHRLQQAGLGLAICTNKPLVPTQTVLAHFQMQQMFPVVIGGDSLPIRKPDPAPLLAAVAQLGLCAGDVLFVGDSEVDAETAQRAGISFALFTEGYRKTDVAALPHQHVFSDFADLPKIVGLS